MSNKKKSKEKEKEVIYAMIDENCNVKTGLAYYKQIIPESDNQTVVLDCGIMFNSPLSKVSNVPKAKTLSHGNGDFNIGFGNSIADALTALAIEIKESR